MSIRDVGSYIGHNRVTSTSQGSASGIWSLAAVERRMRAAAWPQTFPFFPDDLSGLQLWLDAADASTLYNATTGGSLVAADGGVARWEDKSGNARHATQSTSANRPARKTAIQGGLDVLRFDGSNDSLSSSDFLDLSTGQAITAFVVMKRGATGATHTILNKFDKTGDVDTEDGWFFRFFGSNALNAGFAKDGNYTQNTSNSAVTASSFSVLAFKSTAGSLTTSTVLYQNGFVVASSNSGSVQTLDNTNYNVIIGRLPFEGVDHDFLNGDIAEIIIYNSALSDADREAVENYLLAKWGIA